MIITYLYIEKDNLYLKEHIDLRIALNLLIIYPNVALDSLISLVICFLQFCLLLIDCKFFKNSSKNLFDLELVNFQRLSTKFLRILKILN